MTDQFFGITDTGKQRKNNEDTFIAERTANNKFVIACVIDGVGGYSGGEIAAALARESILRRLNRPSGEVIPMIIDCFKLANEKIFQEKQNSKQYTNMACVSTLAVVDIENNQFYYAHVGDTRLYLVRDRSLVKLSHDQSFVGFLEDSGRLSEEEAMNHPKRNEINKALGLDREIGNDDYIETGQSPFLPGDMLLLCSDGLTDMLDSSKIRTIITANKTLKEKCRNLIDAANNSGGKDNVTVVLVQNDKEQAQYMGRPTLPQIKTENTFVNTAKPAEKIAAKETQRETKVKSYKFPVIILSILTLVFMGTTVWQYLQNQNDSDNIAEIKQPVARVDTTKPANKQEIKLQSAIDQLKGHTLILSDTAYTSPILISRAILIKQDSLTLKITGKIVIKCDSGYTNEAVRLSPACKKIVLDSLSLSGFHTGVISYNNALVLKNTRFISCSLPVLNAFTFADKTYVNGKLTGTPFKTDSIPAKTK